VAVKPNSEERNQYECDKQNRERDSKIEDKHFTSRSSQSKEHKAILKLLKHDANHALFDAADKRTRNDGSEGIVDAKPRAQGIGFGHGEIFPQTQVIIMERTWSVKRKTAHLKMRRMTDKASLLNPLMSSWHTKTHK